MQLQNSRNFEFGAVHKLVNLVDLVKSFQTSIYYLLANIGVDTAENGPPKVCQQLANSFFQVRTNEQT